MTSSGTTERTAFCIGERNGFVSKAKNLLLAAHPGHGNGPKQAAAPKIPQIFRLKYLAGGYPVKSKDN